MDQYTEHDACSPIGLDRGIFNPAAVLPYELQVKSIELAMSEFINFLGFINSQLHTKTMPRLESMLMPANFSSIVGEFMASSIPKHAMTLVKNRYHNGHPDLIQQGVFGDGSHA